MRLCLMRTEAEPPEVRAERLRVMLVAFNGMPYLDPAEAAGHGLTDLSLADMALMCDVGDDDLALANACLEIEEELRQRGYAAVERLAVRVAGNAGELDDRIRLLPRPDVSLAISDLYELGWID